MEVVYFKCYLMTGSERKQGGLNSRVHVCVQLQTILRHSHLTKEKACLSLVPFLFFFFCTFSNFNFTCMCLPSPSPVLVKERWSCISLVWSLCTVRKPKAWTQMFPEYLKKTECTLLIIKPLHPTRSTEKTFCCVAPGVSQTHGTISSPVTETKWVKTKQPWQKSRDFCFMHSE